MHRFYQILKVKPFKAFYEFRVSIYKTGLVLPAVPLPILIHHPCTTCQPLRHLQRISGPIMTLKIRGEQTILQIA